jgi:hypothetical protein
VHGNVTCKSLRVDPTVVIVGSLNVNPFAPSRVDPQGNIVDPGVAAPSSAAPSKPADVVRVGGRWFGDWV